MQDAVVGASGNRRPNRQTIRPVMAVADSLLDVLTFKRTFKDVWPSVGIGNRQRIIP